MPPCDYEFVPLQQGHLLSASLNDSTIHAQGVFRIVHFGDSHIQADRITSTIRKEFQRIGGDGGSGIFFPYSLCGSFGPSGVESKVTGNYTYATQLKNPSSAPLGIMGYSILLQKGATLSMTFNEDFKGKKTNSITLWIHSPADTTHLLLDTAWTLTNRRTLGLDMYAYTFETASIPSQLSFTAHITTSFWGIEFNQTAGLCYQQNGLVGAQFSHLIAHEDYVIRQLTAIEPNLLVFSYGTNEAYEVIDTLAYYKKVSRFINRVKTSFPDTPILITNAPDTRSSGKTPPSQISVNETLRKVSVQCSTAYFDLNKAMGGWGSLYTWSKKGFVLKDLLHFNKDGARVLGTLISYAIFTATGLGEEEALTSLKSEIISNLCKTPGEPAITEASIPEAIKPKPAAPKKQAATTSKKGRVYVVKKGDTLSGIAKKTGTTVKQLTTKNKISVNELLHPGQKLKY